MTRRVRILVRIWPWLLALVALFPVLAPGYVLSYDMVFVPDLALRSDFFGLGTGLPRAVPSDVLVALADELVPGMLLQKMVLVGSLVLAGEGARRLVPSDSAVAQLAATSLYVWNPYVAERLGIGHWTVLLAYAALPWVIDFARRMRGGERTLAGLVLWLALAATSASGGVMATVVAVAFTAGRRAADVRRLALVVGVSLAVNAPWVVAGVVHSADAVTDKAGVEAFAAGGEGALPMPFAALGLGGIWNVEVVPASRYGWAAVAGLVLVGLVCAVGFRSWYEAVGRRDALAFAFCGATGVLVALVGALVPQSLAWLVEHVPGTGLLRDGARFLGLLAPLEAGLFGAGAAVLSRVTRERLANASLAAGAVLLPIALMPDLGAGLAGALRPVDFPGEYAHARAVVAASDTDGAVLVLPFTAYRVPPWNGGRRVLDPVGRYLTPNYVSNDELFVSGRRIAGEDDRARRIAALLEKGPGSDLADKLEAEGIAWVVVDRQAEAALGEGRPFWLRSANLELRGNLVTVWSLDSPADIDPGPVVTGVMVAAWTVGGGVVVIAAVGVAEQWWRRRRARKVMT